MDQPKSEAKQSVPWLSHTPYHLSPTVQIAQKLYQKTVHDNGPNETMLTKTTTRKKTQKKTRHRKTKQVKKMESI
jgi:hypothetical protein